MQTLFKKSINLILKNLWPPGSRFFLLPTFLKTDFFCLSTTICDHCGHCGNNSEGHHTRVKIFLCHTPSWKQKFFLWPYCHNLLLFWPMWKQQGGHIFIYIYIYIHIYVYMVLWVQIPLRPTFYSYFKESLYR